MLVFVVVGLVAVALFGVGVVAPRKSRKAQRAIDSALEGAAGTAVEAPGRVGEWLAKPFRKSRKAADTSSRAGRKTRFKLPF